MFTVENFPGQSFSKAVLITGAALLIFAALLILFVILFGRREKREGKGEVTDKTRSEIKRQALAELWSLRGSFVKGEISVRDTYQSMSRLMRDFTYDMTGVQVKHFTLKELKRKRLPELTSLIQDYYEPEFAGHTKADTLSAIEKTRRVIENWI